MTAFTPGPWRVTMAHHSTMPLRVETEGGKPVAIADYGRDEARENARLIAAAPDLLSALVKFVNTEDEALHFGQLSGETLAAVLKQARAAIAKATTP